MYSNSLSPGNFHKPGKLAAQYIHGFNLESLKIVLRIKQSHKFLGNLNVTFELFLFDCFLYNFPSGQNLFQQGKVNFSVSYPDLVHCKTVQYPQVFSGSGNIRVLASISQENKPPSVHDSAVAWTTEVTQNNFRVCVLESGLGTNGSIVVNWVAFRGTPSGALDGTASFNAFTSGTQCERVDFAQVNTCSSYFISFRSSYFISLENFSYLVLVKHKGSSILRRFS